MLISTLSENMPLHAILYHEQCLMLVLMYIGNASCYTISAMPHASTLSAMPSHAILYEKTHMLHAILYLSNASCYTASANASCYLRCGLECFMLYSTGNASKSYTLSAMLL